MASKIGKTEWTMLLVITGIIDVLQIVFAFLGTILSETVVALVLIVINEYADPFIGGLMLAYFQLRGVNMFTKPARVLSLLGVAGLDEITGGYASFWILDVWYIRRDVRKEEAQVAQQDEINVMLESSQRQPLYRNGARQPYSANTSNSRNSRPLNSAGISRARGVR